MSPLEEYRRKRDFAVTPEPVDAVERDHTGLAYVIQKHAASRLHWDFRIELDGVLLSWAVPKGPSLDPSEKHLAMRVEDHPVAYGSFEGVIPKGEYGGGTVMVWDRGTWEPDHGDPRQHLAEGHLKFYLYGERLRGRWMLVKTKGYGRRPQENSWLLFKERDDEVRPHSEFDATAEWMTSVATGRTMEEIAEDVSAVWHSVGDPSEEATGTAHDARTTPPAPATGDATAARESIGDVEGVRPADMPTSVDVALALLVEDAPSGDRWLHEVKFDGYRVVAFLDHGHVRLVSRNAKDWTDRFGDVASAVAALSAEQAVIDGEVVVMRPDGSTDFQALQNFARRGHAAELHYMAFDLLHLNGFDLTGTPLEKRKELLENLIPRHADRIRYSEHVEGHGDAFYRRACDLSLEGMVSKRRDSTYRSGRGRDWLKVKCLLRQEFVVVGYTDPGGSRKGFGALILALNDGGGLKLSGRVGTGFNEQMLADLHRRLAALERETPPVSDAPSGSAAAGIHWVEPQLVAEVAFAEWTEVGQLRHPSFMGLREDKSPSEVKREMPSEPPRPPAAENRRPSGPAVAGVTLSNPDRVLWPDAKVTKLELAHYYESVVDLMLPHVSGRPLSLVRCPTGYTGECFYQKHIENFPKAVGTVGVYEPENDTVSPYAVVNGLPGIVGLVQMGVLEIHPWGSRTDDVDRPDRLILDLDPDPSLPWSTVATTALLLRSELERLGLQSWAKTTGGKGLHVVAPVDRRSSWTELRDFSHAFVESIVAIEPRLFTANMSKAQRTGKIFIDYVRNTRGSTAIAPYSSRARPGAPVSVPLFWDELQGASERPEYSVTNLRARLGELDGDPWADLPGTRQSITKPMRRQLGLS